MKRFAPKAVFAFALAALCVFGFVQMATPPAQAFNCPSGYGPCIFRFIRIYPDEQISCCVYRCPWGEEEGPCFYDF